jgi:hypothetical protein
MLLPETVIADNKRRFNLPREIWKGQNLLRANLVVNTYFSIHGQEQC